MKTLEEYLKENMGKAFFGYQLKVSHVDEDGKPNIYIHPMSVNGDTLDFVVDGNTLIPKRQIKVEE